MTPEDKLHLQLNKGAKAETELKMLGSAFQEVRAEMVRVWQETVARDTAGREKIWVATTILTQVENVLRTYVANGKVAQKQLEELRKAGERQSLLDRITPKQRYHA